MSRIDRFTDALSVAECSGEALDAPRIEIVGPVEINEFYVSAGKSQRVSDSLNFAGKSYANSDETLRKKSFELFSDSLTISLIKVRLKN